MANGLNDFFVSIGSSLDSRLPHVDYDPLAHMISSVPQSFYFHPVSPDEVEKIIADLKITKTDLDSIPVSMLKRISKLVSLPISKLINKSFTVGYFPDSLKIARITPVFKKGDEKNPTNYRPIASLPLFSKIFEKCAYKRLMKYFNNFNLFTEQQFGFRNNMSTCDALINLTEHINLDDSRFHVSALIDHAKAFDTLNHDIPTLPKVANIW